MTVYLVGAGPGDPGLITARGAEVLGRAHVVVHDRLAGSALLALAPSGAELIDVGKRPGGPVDQEGINRLLVERGRSGSTVVRLKGGDPFVFGRGGEEARALLDAGLAFEVVPGVSAATAVPAYAGVPVTHRGLAASYTVVTGHSASSADAGVDWEALARAGGTIVVLMGVAHRDDIARRLISGGRSPDTPAVAVRWGTRADQTSVRTTLAQLADVPLEPPATIVIGPVAGLDVGWFERRPLFGWRVVVTRAQEQSSGLSSRLAEAGALPVEAPVLAICDPADGGAALEAAAESIAAYEWVVFTSANAVTRFVPLLRDARAFGGIGIAVIGPATAGALRDHNLVPDLVAADQLAESLVEAFPDPSGTARVLIPRAASARDVIPAGLGTRGWKVDLVEAYRTEHSRLSPEVLDLVRAADAVCFTSSSTVTALVGAVGADALPPVVACIGPITSDTARAAGVRVDAIAAEHTTEGLVSALVELAARRGGNRPPLG